jgi:hypothetical protein
MTSTFRRVVSGGQTGADQAGLRTARNAGIETGGWAPKGWDTEDGPAEWLADFGLTECSTPGYPPRTAANARDSDGTLWFGSTDSSGYRATINACQRFGKPYLIVEDGTTRPSHVIEWMTTHRVSVLNVAGNRESKNPGLGERVEAFLSRVFALTKPPAL